MLQRNKNTAYSMVAEALRHQILSGELPPGGRLPPERELCTHFSASRITIRRALQILEEELLIRRQQGSGTYVSPAPSRKIPILNTDFFGSVARHAPDLQRRLVLCDWRRAEPGLASQLNTFPNDRVLYAQRVDMLGSTAVAMDDVFLLGRFAEKLTESALSEMSFLERWQADQKIEIGYILEGVEAVPAETPVAELLGVAEGAPLLKGTDVIYLTGDRAAGVFISHYRHEYFRLIATVRFPRQTERVP